MNSPTEDQIAERIADEAEWVAIGVMHHIDTMYPGLWKQIPSMAKVSIRNTILTEFGLAATRLLDLP